MKGDFSFQKSKIGGAAIGRDHAGEQVNKILKTRGVITGITRNENSCNRHFLIGPALEAIAEKMMEIDGISS